MRACKTPIPQRRTPIKRRFRRAAGSRVTALWQHHRPSQALSIIVAVEGLIPDRRAGSAEKNPAAPPIKASIYESAWLREQKRKPPASHPTLPSKKMGLATPRPNPLRLSGRRLSALRSCPRPYLLPKRVHLCLGNAIAASRRFCSRHQGPLLYQKEPLCPASLTGECIKRPQNDRILSNFIKTGGHTEPYLSRQVEGEMNGKNRHEVH